MVEAREELEAALEAIESTELERLIEEGNPEDFDALREVALAPETPPERRRRALSALGSWSGRETDSLETIRSALPELNDRELISAAAALGRIGTPEARDLLIELEVAAPDVRRQIVRSLARIGDDPACDELQKIAEVEQVGYVRDLAARELERLEEAQD